MVNFLEKHHSFDQIANTFWANVLFAWFECLHWRCLTVQIWQMSWFQNEPFLWVVLGTTFPWIRPELGLSCPLEGETKEESSSSVVPFERPGGRFLRMTNTLQAIPSPEGEGPGRPARQTAPSTTSLKARSLANRSSEFCFGKSEGFIMKPSSYITLIMVLYWNRDGRI